MKSKNDSPNKDDWRNSTQPYSIKLAAGNYILSEDDLRPHIDRDTFAYKQWVAPELGVLSLQGNMLELSNTNSGLRYILTVRIEKDQFDVSCSCDRKVEYLCHHAYHGLRHIINQYGNYYFKAKL